MNTSTLTPPTNATVISSSTGSSREARFKARAAEIAQESIASLKAAWAKRVEERGLEQAMKDNGR